jgi:hypothetical protein
VLGAFAWSPSSRRLGGLGFQVCRLKGVPWLANPWLSGKRLYRGPCIGGFAAHGGFRHDLGSLAANSLLSRQPDFYREFRRLSGVISQCSFSFHILHSCHDKWQLSLRLSALVGGDRLSARGRPLLDSRNHVWDPSVVKFGARQIPAVYGLLELKDGRLARREFGDGPRVRTRRWRAGATALGQDTSASPRGANAPLSKHATVVAVRNSMRVQ